MGHLHFFKRRRMGPCNSLLILESKMKLLNTKIRFLEFDIDKGQYKPIYRSSEYTKRIPGENKEKIKFHLEIDGRIE